MARKSKSGRRTRKHRGGSQATTGQRGGSQCGTRLNVGQTGGSQATTSQRGGGWGFTGASSIPGTPGTVSNPQVFTGIGDCRAVEPGYTIPISNYGASMKGLPGMSGGKRRKSRKGKGRKTRKQKGGSWATTGQRGGSWATTGQRGGRYGFFPEGDPNPSGQLYYAGSYAPVQRIACEGTSPNPLNPTHTGSSAPPGAANPNYWMKGGQRGGAQTMAPATYGVGNVDSMYYYAPTAGYANTASAWKDSVGAPVQIQVPYAAREMNQACLTTGGPPPLTGALQKGGRRTRKQQRGGEGILNKAKNALRGVPGLGKLFGTAPAANLGGLGEAYKAVNESASGNGASSAASVSLPASPIAGNESNSNSNSNSMAPPPPPPSSPTMGGMRKHKRRHGKKRTHKRKH